MHITSDIFIIIDKSRRFDSETIVNMRTTSMIVCTVGWKIRCGIYVKVWLSVIFKPVYVYLKSVIECSSNAAVIAQ